MTLEPIPQELKQEVWKRDEFTCRFCGKTTTWEEVHILFDIPPESGGKMEPTNLLTVCSQCVWEGKTAPIAEKEKQRVLSLVRELISYTNVCDDVIFEEDYEQEVLKLNKKVEDLKEDIRRMSAALQERDKIAIAYKKKTDRAYQDMENLKRRMDADIKMRVREGTRSILMSMIASLDNIERAMEDARRNQDIREVANVLSGLEFIHKGMVEQLQSKGVEIIEAQGRLFDPRYHEGVGSRTEKKIPANTVLEVLERGFLYQELVLRPAKVIVSRGGPKRKVEEPPELEEFELDENGDEEGPDVLELEPWNPKLEVVVDEEDEEYVVKAPKRKK